jgi:hypothetical protein
MRHHDDLKRSLRGAIWGLAATAMMTAVMVIGALVFRSGFARPPFPYLFIDHLRAYAGGGASAALLTVFAHFAFGGVMGMVFAYFSEPMTFAKGVGFSVLAWSMMQVIFIPWLGWGDFGLIHSQAVSFVFYTLILHLTYGVTLGALGARDDRIHDARFDDLGRLRTHAV